ncbi:MAG: prepilin-type N-terminal cleavage/methylation domain-containing protein [Opitutaceae bacterium]|nr:prepilin-type N-terminal cleavage/methylation domain-containing protein [Opitutaceae bacterium]
MKTPNRRGAKRAFTLIELLTVIAIIGILAAILIPTVGAVRKRALKSQCASNLRQLGTAVNLYINDNKQRLPNGTDQNANLQWLSTDHRDAFKNYGMTFEMFYCRGNPTYMDANMTTANREKIGGNGIPIGYVYLPGTSYTAKDQFGRDIPSKYRETRLSKVTYRLIAADLNRKWNSDFAGGVNHADNNSPIGGNHLYLDGAVKWFSAVEFVTRPAISGGGSEYYFKTED